MFSHAYETVSFICHHNCKYHITNSINYNDKIQDLYWTAVLSFVFYEGRRLKRHFLLCSKFHSDISVRHINTINAIGF